MSESLDLLRTRAEAWAAADPDPESAAEMRRLAAAGDEAELADRFDGRLQFGTAGLRGIIGAGPNRMNRAVARQATAGLARYLLKTAPESASKGVVVGRDASIWASWCRWTARITTGLRADAAGRC